MKNIFPILLFCSIFLTDCGYFENDGIEKEVSVFGKIKLRKYENSNEMELVLQQSPQISAVIVQNCKKVCTDSSRRHLFIESEINAYNMKYLDVFIKDSTSVDTHKALKITPISVQTFTNSVMAKSANTLLDR
ncbi:hypothetical protein CNR22_19500 [Sphingobacteriaceae bacterium]|nr:hypothetical protein CNR22_19500 [Sphingobacteriaceae bacterium]